MMGGEGERGLGVVVPCPKSSFFFLMRGDHSALLPLPPSVAPAEPPTSLPMGRISESAVGGGLAGAG